MHKIMLDIVVRSYRMSFLPRIYIALYPTFVVHSAYCMVLKYYITSIQ